MSDAAYSNYSNGIIYAAFTMQTHGLIYDYTIECLGAGYNFRKRHQFCSCKLCKKYNESVNKLLDAAKAKSHHKTDFIEKFLN